MGEDLQVIIEMNESTWNRFRADLQDVTLEEVDWRPLPQANSINVIVRHLRIEAQWHLASLEHGERMPSDFTPSLQQQIDSVPLEFDRNMKELDELYTSFIAVLHRTTEAVLQEHTTLAYQLPPDSCPIHFLGYHQSVHLAMHWGQIRTIRNLYRKTRGEPAWSFPDNPSFPKSQGGS